MNEDRKEPPKDSVDPGTDSREGGKCTSLKAMAMKEDRNAMSGKANSVSNKLLDYVIFERPFRSLDANNLN